MQCLKSGTIGPSLGLVSAWLGQRVMNWVTGLNSRYHTFLITQDLVIYYGHTENIIIFHNYIIIGF